MADYNIAMGFKPLELQNPMVGATQLAQLENAGNQNALAQYQLSAAKRAETATNVQNQLYAKHYNQDTGGVNMNALAAEAAQLGQGSIIPKLQASELERRAKQATLEHTQAQTGEITYKRGVAQTTKAIQDIAGFGSKDDALAALDARAKSGALPLDKAAQMRASILNAPDFATWQNSTLRSILDAKDQLHQTYTSQNVGNAAQIVATPTYGGAAPSVVSSAPVAVSPNTVATNARMAAEGAANRTAAMERVVKSAEGGQLDPEAIDFLAQQVNLADTSVLTGLARSKGAVAAVRNRAVQLAKEANLTPSDLTTANVDMQGQKAGSRSLGTTLANVTAAASEADKMIGIAQNYATKINPTDFPAINAAGNYIAKNTGDPTQAGLATSLNSLVNAYARAINPKGVATVSDKNHAREIINASMSSGQFNEVFAVMKQEMAAAKAAPVEARALMRPAAPASPAKGGENTRPPLSSFQKQ